MSNGPQIVGLFSVFLVVDALTLNSGELNGEELAETSAAAFDSSSSPAFITDVKNRNLLREFSRNFTYSSGTPAVMFAEPILSPAIVLWYEVVSAISDALKIACNNEQLLGYLLSWTLYGVLRVQIWGGTSATCDVLIAVYMCYFDHPIKTNIIDSAIHTVTKKKVFAATDYDIVAFLQDSENWDLGDDVPSPVKLPPKKAHAVVEFPVKSDRRHLESRCVWLKYPYRQTHSPLLSENPHFTCQIHVRDVWLSQLRRTMLIINRESDVLDDIFNVLGTSSGPSSPTRRTISITSHSNLLVLYPDILITTTALSNATQCRRKPLLSSLVRSMTDITPAVIWENMLHEVMQKCLLELQREDNFIETCIVEATMGSLAELNCEEGNLKSRKRIPVFCRKISCQPTKGSLFLPFYLSIHSTAALTNTRSAAFEAPSLLAITDILEIEKTSGRIVSSTHQDSVSAWAQDGTRASRHGPRAQTILYTLLLSERYGSDIQGGLLFYSQSKTGETVRVPRGRNEEDTEKGADRVEKEEVEEEDVEVDVEDTQIRVESAFQSTPDENRREEEEEYFCQHISTTNEHANGATRSIHSHPNHSISAPPPWSKSKVKHRATFDPPIPPFLAPNFEAKTGHLTPTHTNFFTEWEQLLALEEMNLVRFKRELWMLGAEERGRKGRRFSGMPLIPSRAGTAAAGRKSGASSSGTIAGLKEATTNVNPLNGHLSVEDAITISVEPRLLALVAGELGAMDKVLSAEDYALVLGMPGTEKTTVIAALIRELVVQGKTVLLSER
ncbi:hypothetical protein CVT25_009384 [Psilocybe cyanescens]|uniref:DNA replication factor Dna2 N-terminal domain-containing protein n=1 Tax=Psilocybe cyanescens TaxID=93625 RepID=A0A409XV05_PSICY|nr:hypothetical protein CVT25_009384 [Psilocybe cyanescens]